MQQMSTLDVITPSPVSPPRMTEDEYVNWVDEKAQAEWVAGEVRFKMAIDELHDVLQTIIKAALMALVHRRSLGQVRGDHFAMRLPQRPSRREPDVMFISSANPSSLTQTLLDGPCDLALEIVSPSSIEEDYSLKFSAYEAAGVREYWIVDPIRKVIAAYRLVAGVYVPIAVDGDGRVASIVVEGWWLNAQQLFADRPPDVLGLMRSLGIV